MAYYKTKVEKQWRFLIFRYWKEEILLTDVYLHGYSTGFV
jgi:hypothetical protein